MSEYIKTIEVFR